MNASVRHPRGAPPIRLVQFSDCHVQGTPGAVYRGVDSRQTLAECLAVVRSYGPDLLIGTGDLSEDYSEASYHYLKHVLTPVGCPFLTLPGNHDDASSQQRIMVHCPVDRALVHDVGSWRLVLLNSAVSGEVPGSLSREMLSSLETALGSRPGPKAVFLHHQPLPVGSPWIDRYALKHPERLWEVLDAASDIQLVAWGHIHQPFTAVRNKVRLLGSPSTAVNSLPGREKLTPDPRGPACRWLELADDGSFETGVLGKGWSEDV